jgi:hypothetical protein
MRNLLLRGIVPLCVLALVLSVQAAPVAAAALTVHVVVAPNPVVRHVKAFITATTKPGAQCTVRVLYEATGYYATSRSLRVVQVADRAGHVMWSWESATKRQGTGVATVECTHNAVSGVGMARFVVH